MYITIDIGGTNIRVAASLTLDTKLIKDQIKFTLVHNFDQDFANLIRININSSPQLLLPFIT